jgi:hypothetical protein
MILGYFHVYMRDMYLRVLLTATRVRALELAAGIGVGG